MIDKSGSRSNWLDTRAFLPERFLCFLLVLFVFGVIGIVSSSSAAYSSRSAESKGDPARGQQLFEKRCIGCHALDRDKEGPRLRGVFGRKAGTVSAFPYSEGVKSSGITWDTETLDRWLMEPAKLVPDANMDFRVPNAGDRTDVIAYLQQLSK